MKYKNYGCAGILLPWILLVAGAILLGEPKDFKLASFIGLTITFYWPMVGMIISWVGSAMHMLFGFGDSDPTPGQTFMHMRRGKSMQLFLTLSATLFGVIMAYATDGTVNMASSIIVGIPLVGGAALYVILYFQSCATDRWTLEQQSQAGVPGFEWTMQEQ